MQVNLDDVLAPFVNISSAIIENIPNFIIAVALLLITAVITQIVKRSIKRALGTAHIYQEM